MTRKEFFGRTLGGVLASIGLSKVAKATPTATFEDEVQFPYKDKGIFYPEGHSRTGTQIEYNKNGNYLQTFREEYHVLNGQVNHKVFFTTGKLEVTDPGLAESLLNHPRCKK